MIKLGVREYIKNFWLNFISVIMICIMIISTLILTTTILRQTRIYRLISPSLGKEGVVTTIIDKDSIDKLKDVDNIIMASDTYFSSLDGNKGYKVTIYNNRMCKYIAPRLSSGKWIDDVSGKNNMIKVVISENNYGIKAGDKLEITANSENGEQNSIEIYVCGVLEEGQRVFNTFSEIDSDCTYKDFFHIYSFEQDQVPLMITTERETKKLDFKLDVQYGNAFIKYSDKISDENKENNLEILNSKFEEMTGISNYEDSFIQLKDLTKRSDKEIKNLCITYIPLIFGDFILIIVCLIGIVAVKTSKNTGYYGKLYLCGMNMKKAIWLSIGETTISCTLAIILSGIIFIIQEKLEVIKLLNMDFELIQCLIILIMSVLTILFSAIMSEVVIHENTPVDMLRKVK